VSSTCKSCKAAIKWVVLPSGKRMPVDAKGVSMVQLSADGERGTVIHVHASHFSTCPEAAQHRKTKP
jgi:hypothetical protein